MLSSVFLRSGAGASFGGRSAVQPGGGLTRRGGGADDGERLGQGEHTAQGVYRVAVHQELHAVYGGKLAQRAENGADSADALRVAASEVGFQFAGEVHGGKAVGEVDRPQVGPGGQRAIGLRGQGDKGILCGCVRNGIGGGDDGRRGKNGCGKKRAGG